MSDKIDKLILAVIKEEISPYKNDEERNRFQNEFDSFYKFYDAMIPYRDKFKKKLYKLRKKGQINKIAELKHEEAAMNNAISQKTKSFEIIYSLYIEIASKFIGIKPDVYRQAIKDYYNNNPINSEKGKNIMNSITKHICGKCKKDAYEICSRCKKIYYCDASCQKEHWFQYKDECFEVLGEVD